MLKIIEIVFLLNQIVGAQALNQMKIVNKGKTLFMQNCTSCHGQRGYGDGPAAKAMTKIKPRNLVQDKFKNGDSLNEVAQTIHRGIPPLMPAWSLQLKENEINSIAEYVIYIRNKKN